MQRGVEGAVAGVGKTLAENVVGGQITRGEAREFFENTVEITDRTEPACVGYFGDGQIGVALQHAHRLVRAHEVELPREGNARGFTEIARKIRGAHAHEGSGVLEGDVAEMQVDLFEQLFEGYRCFIVFFFFGGKRFAAEDFDHELFDLATCFRAVKGRFFGEHCAQFAIRLGNGIVLFQHRAGKRETFRKKTNDVIIENEHNEDGIGLRCVHVMHLFAVDKQSLPDGKRITFSVAEYVDPAPFEADQLAVGVPVQQIVRIAVFARPHFSVVGIFPNFTFCKHIA